MLLYYSLCTYIERPKYLQGKNSILEMSTKRLDRQLESSGLGDGGLFNLFGWLCDIDLYDIDT